MIILNDKRFIKTAFKNEEELEQVVVDNYEYIFGPSSIYLPKKIIKTSDGLGTVPDGFAIDLMSRKWFIVEAELLHHNVWIHIAPQIAKQIIAAQQPLSKKVILELAVEEFQKNDDTKDKFFELGIKELNVRKELGEILENEPIIGLPIDNISNDLRQWARTLKNNVKLWLINKFVDFSDPSQVIYEFPEEFKPELDTEEEESSKEKSSKVNTYDVTIEHLIIEGFLSDGQVLEMVYKPSNGDKRRYTAILDGDGNFNLLDQVFSSPSYAALAGIQDAGSSRKTVNGWTSWKNANGKSLADLRQEYLDKKETQEKEL